MAILIPKNLPKTSSYAEIQVFEKLKELPDDYIVMYSLGLSKHMYKIRGEIDFVVICKKGILCIEVKGGKVGRKDGSWTVKTITGEKNEIENPFAQVCGNMFSLRDYLIKADKSVKENLFISLVVTPKTDLKVKGPDIESEELINCNQLKYCDIKGLINNRFEFYHKKFNEKYSYRKKDLTELEINRIKILLRADLGYAVSLSSDLEEIKEEIITLTEEQQDIFDKMKENERIIIKGTGGTGKTVLLFEQAQRLAILGQKVVLICYNRSLSQHLNNLLLKNGSDETKKNIKISTLHAYMLEQLGIKCPEKKTDDYFKKELPQKFLQLNNNEQYDVMFIDEAQDILTDTYLKCLERILKGGLKCGKWYMSVDRKQNLYNNTELDKSLDYIKKEIKPAITILTKNCRNTKQISDFNYKLTNIEQSINDSIIGEDVKTIKYSNREDQQNKVKKIIKELHNQGIKNSEITILSKNIFKYSIFNNKNFLEDLSAQIEEIGEYLDTNEENKYIKFSTIKKFKGLESKVIILCDVDKIDDEESKMLNYVAISRAKALLFVLYNEEITLQY